MTGIFRSASTSRRVSTASSVRSESIHMPDALPNGSVSDPYRSFEETSWEDVDAFADPTHTHRDPRITLAWSPATE